MRRERLAIRSKNVRSSFVFMLIGFRFTLFNNKNVNLFREMRSFLLTADHENAGKN